MGDGMADSRCIVCGFVAGTGPRDCAGCGLPSSREKSITSSGTNDDMSQTSSTENSDSKDSEVTSISQVFRASFDLEELSKITFGLSIVIGLLGFVVGLATWISLLPGEGQEGSPMVAFLTGATVATIVIIQALLIALFSRFTLLKALQARLPS